MDLRGDFRCLIWLAALSVITNHFCVSYKCPIDLQHAECCTRNFSNGDYIGYCSTIKSASSLDVADIFYGKNKPFSQSNTMYKSAQIHWKNVESDDNGMLGGLSHLSPADIHDSTQFLRFLITKLKVGTWRALDCGCGIGRVTKLLLLPIFRTVDMVDVTEKFIHASSAYLGPDLNGRIGQKFCCGLQDFVPLPRHYDVVWMQWVSGQLTDLDIVDFLRSCSTSLTPGGVVVVKDNVAFAGEKEFDPIDSSFARNREELMRIFKQANLQIVLEKVQENFPDGLYEVRIFALRPMHE